MLARANIAEEQRPCATMRDSAPDQPHCVFDIVPAINSPMCPTDE